MWNLASTTIIHKWPANNATPAALNWWFAASYSWMLKICYTSRKSNTWRDDRPDSRKEVISSSQGAFPCHCCLLSRRHRYTALLFPFIDTPFIRPRPLHTDDDVGFMAALTQRYVIRSCITRCCLVVCDDVTRRRDSATMMLGPLKDQVAFHLDLTKSPVFQ